MIEDDKKEDCPIGGCDAVDYDPDSYFCQQCISGVAGDNERKERMED